MPTYFKKLNLFKHFVGIGTVWNLFIRLYIDRVGSGSATLALQWGNFFSLSTFTLKINGFEVGENFVPFESSKNFNFRKYRRYLAEGLYSEFAVYRTYRI